MIFLLLRLKPKKHLKLWLDAGDLVIMSSCVKCVCGDTTVGMETCAQARSLCQNTMNLC